MIWVLLLSFHSFLLWQIRQSSCLITSLQAVFLRWDYFRMLTTDKCIPYRNWVKCNTKHEVYLGRGLWGAGCQKSKQNKQKNVLACFLCSLAPLFSNWTPAKERISVKDKWLLVDLAFAIQEVNPPQFDWKSVAWTLQLMYINVLDSFCLDEPKLALKVIFKWITLCYSECICKNCNF